MIEVENMRERSAVKDVRTVDTDYVNEFNALVSSDKEAQEKLNDEHRLYPFSPWYGLLVIRFSDNTTMQTNWTKLASAVEKMRRDTTYVVALLELASTNERQNQQMIGGGLIPSRTERKIFAYSQTRMLNEQSGRMIV